MSLFSEEELQEAVSKTSYNKDFTCGKCKNRQTWQCGSKTINYCTVRKSNRTATGLLKVKCKDKACASFKNN